MLPLMKLVYARKCEFQHCSYIMLNINWQGNECICFFEIHIEARKKNSIYENKQLIVKEIILTIGMP